MEAAREQGDGTLTDASAQLAAMFGDDDADAVLDATEGSDFDTATPDRAAADEADPTHDADEPGDAEDDESEAAGDAEAEREAEEDDETDETGEESGDDSYDMPELLQVRDTDTGHEFGMEIDGQFRTLDELRRSPLFEADYTRKTQEVAAQRNEAQATLTEAAQARQTYLNGLTEVENAVKAVTRERTPEEWRALRDSDRNLYDAEKDAYDDGQQQLAALQQHRVAVEAEQQQYITNQRVVSAQACEAGLLDLVPSWSDPTVMKSEVDELVSYVTTTYGVTPEERSSTLDPRSWDMARKAMLYDKLMDEGTQAKRKAKKASPTLKAGRPTTTQERAAKKSRTLTNARKRLRSTGSVKDASSALEELFKRQE